MLHDRYRGFFGSAPSDTVKSVALSHAQRGQRTTLDDRQLDWRLVARRYEVSVAAIPATDFVAIIRVTQHLSARGSQRLSYAC